MNRPISAETFAQDAAAGEGPCPPDAAQRTRIGRTYRFEAAHYLPLVSQGHRCRNLHGHNYRVAITVRGKLDGRGFVRDFAEIDALVAPLLHQVDHRLLNEVKGLENPTAEMIAAWFLKQIPARECVRVDENDDSGTQVTR